MAYAQSEQGQQAFNAFQLVPLNPQAMKVTDHSKNQDYRVVDQDTVGLWISFHDPEKQYVTLGRRDCDITLPEPKGSKHGVEITDFHASFHVVEETGAVVLTDRSTRKNTEMLPVEHTVTISFREPKRSVIVCRSINTCVAFGRDNYYQFEIRWKSDGLYDFPDKNEPYLTGPRKSKSKKYVQGYGVGAGQYGNVVWAIDAQTGNKIAVKKFHNLSGKNLEFATREVKNLFRITEGNSEQHVGTILPSSSPPPSLAPC